MDLSRDMLLRLYTTDPNDFLSVRTELSAVAKKAGDADLAREITAQRKPTVAAWIVNRQVHDDPGSVDRLIDLGARLRVAHEDLDAATLRELSTERRHLVDTLTTAALQLADRANTPVALRDEISGTFDAAVADPQIAARLGRLTRPEQWSGFGVALDVPPGTPELTVIRGGRDRSAQTARPSAGSPKAQPAPRADPATTRRSRRARDKAETAFAAAEAALHDSEAAEHGADTRVRELTAELARVQAELDEAGRALEQSRRDTKSARNRRREARSALDRAERQLDRNDS